MNLHFVSPQHAYTRFAPDQEWLRSMNYSIKQVALKVIVRYGHDCRRLQFLTAQKVNRSDKGINGARARVPQHIRSRGPWS